MFESRGLKPAASGPRAYAHYVAEVAGFIFDNVDRFRPVAYLGGPPRGRRPCIFVIHLFHSCPVLFIATKFSAIYVNYFAIFLTSECTKYATASGRLRSPDLLPELAPGPRRGTSVPQT